MSQCTDCGTCRGRYGKPSSGRMPVVVAGNPNVGKTTIFCRLIDREAEDINVPGSTYAVSSGRVGRDGAVLFDTPGTYSIFAHGEDQVVSRDVLLLAHDGAERPGVLLVADAKNVKRSLALALQVAEYGLPMLLAVNMMDEAEPRGIQIDLRKLSEMLDVEVCGTIAREGIGLRTVLTKLGSMRVPRRLLTYPPNVEHFMATVAKLLGRTSVSPRAVSLLLLAGDSGVRHYLHRTVGPEMKGQLESLAERIRREHPGDVTLALGGLFVRKAEQLVRATVTVEAPLRAGFATRLGDWCAELHTGIPIAMLVLTAMYLFVGSFGASALVTWINGSLFRGLVLPWLTALVRPVPSAFLRDLLVDPEFGMVPSGLFLALGLVMPVMFCFYLAFGSLEDSGYLPRLSILLDRILRKMGLNGKAVVPIVMGFSCVTMALLTTRILDTKKERNIASFVLFLCIPCAPLVAVMLAILERMPLSATLTVFGLVAAVIVGAGYVADKVLPGDRTPLLLELPPLRWPRPVHLVRAAGLKTGLFLKEAVPVFVLASVIVFLIERTGGLDAAEGALRPLTGGLLGLPEKSVQVFLKTLVRRESGAAELLQLSGLFSNLQLVVTLVVMTFLVPCLNSTMVLFKERGPRAAAMVFAPVALSAIAIGSVMNHFCRFFGITFS